MTTEKAEAQYLGEHLRHWEGKGWAVYNPNNLPEEDLNVIYGFNNGGSRSFLTAQLVSDTGYGMGNHMCSHELYMQADLGILEGSALKRHEGFKESFPDGYRMEWVPTDEQETNEGFKKALKLAEKVHDDSETASNASVKIEYSKDDEDT